MAYDPDDPGWPGATVGENVGFALSRFAKATDWEELVDLFKRNQRLVTGSIPIKGRTGLPKKYEVLGDYREASFRHLDNQLKDIKKRFGSIHRKTIWFTQKLGE